MYQRGLGVDCKDGTCETLRKTKYKEKNTQTQTDVTGNLPLHATISDQNQKQKKTS